MPDPSRTLKVAIPKGSLQEPTIELLAKAGYEIYVSSRGLRPSSNDPELDLFLIRAQEIGRYGEYMITSAVISAVISARASLIGASRVTIGPTKTRWI